MLKKLLWSILISYVVLLTEYITLKKCCSKQYVNSIFFKKLTKIKNLMIFWKIVRRINVIFFLFSVKNK